MPVSFRFYSRRSEMRSRTGIGILAGAFLAYALGEFIVTLAWRLTFLIPGWLIMGAWYARNWLSFAAGIAGFVSILCITQPLARDGERFRPHLAAVTSLLALIAMLVFLVDMAFTLGGISRIALPAGMDPALNVAFLLFFTAHVLLPVHLLSRIDRTREQTLWWLMCLGLAAFVLILFNVVGGVICNILKTEPFIPGYSTGRAELAQRLLALVRWWYRNMVPACRAVVLLACFVFLIRLRVGPRKPC